MRLRRMLLATTLLAVPGVASAQTFPGWGVPQPSGVYIGAGAGFNWLQDSDVNSNNQLRDVIGTGSVSFDYGFGGVLSVGYAFGNGIRVEVEGSYRYNSVSGISGFNTTQLPAPRTQGGDAVSWGAFVNAFYDFDLGWRVGEVGIVPYLGLGIGYLQTEWNNASFRGPGGNAIIVDGDDGTWGGQVIAGLAFPIASVPGLALTAEYRYMAAFTNPSLNSRAVSVTGAQTATRNGSVDVDNENHSLLFGVRYIFGVAPLAPAPVVAPPPAAAPAPARTYLVFFDFDRADLTDRARQIIADAARTSTAVQTTRIEIAGHADRAGTPQYNQRLSERRAAAVAAELERQGVPRSAMTVQAFGESRPLVPTADGVREPQNRRVEIVLR